MLVNGLILVRELEHNASVSENFVPEKSFNFGEFGLGFFFSFFLVSVSKNLASEKSLGFG